MEGELIYVAIIMQIGTLITILLWSNLSLRKYFAKENFKTSLANVRATNKINLKKMERELGLKSSSGASHTESPPITSALGQLSQLAPLIKNLDPDQLGALVDKFTGEGELLEDEQGGGILDGIPQSLIDTFLKGLKEGAGDGTQTQPENAPESQV